MNFGVFLGCILHSLLAYSIAAIPSLPFSVNFDSLEDLSKFSNLDLPDSGDSFTVSSGYATARSIVTNNADKGRAEACAQGLIFNDFKGETFRNIRLKFSAPTTVNSTSINQIGIFGQAIQEYQNKSQPWDPIFFLMAWPGSGVQLSVYSSGRDAGSHYDVFTISNADPRGNGFHTVELWGYFTKSSHGYYDVSYDFGKRVRLYSGNTLFGGGMKGDFKIGTYAGYHGFYAAETWIDELSISDFANLPRSTKIMHG